MSIHACHSVKLQQICLRTWNLLVRPASWSTENQREMLLDRCPYIRHTNLHCETLVGKTIATLSMQHTCLLVQCHSMAVAAAATNMSSGLVLLPHNTAAVQACLLVECSARWVLAGPLSLNQHACRSFTTQSCMSAGVVLLYVWCLIISRACWCGASL